MALFYFSFFSRFFSNPLDVRLHHHHQTEKGFLIRFLESFARRTESEKRSKYFGSDPLQ